MIDWYQFIRQIASIWWCPLRLEIPNKHSCPKTDSNTCSWAFPTCSTNCDPVICRSCSAAWSVRDASMLFSESCNSRLKVYCHFQFMDGDFWNHNCFKTIISQRLDMIKLSPASILNKFLNCSWHSFSENLKKKLKWMENVEWLKQLSQSWSK